MFLCAFILSISFVLSAQVPNQQYKKEKKHKKEKIYNEKGELIKTGWNFGPLPIVGYNTDLGFQYGACVDIFNYGDGSKYPKYDYKMNLELSTYTKGSGVIRFYGDYNNLIAKSKLFVDIAYFIDKKFNFYGFNGYVSPYFNDIAVIKNNNSFNVIHDAPSAFYVMRRNQFRFNLCLQHPINSWKHLYYGVGLSYFNYDTGRLRISKYDNQITLYELYCKSGLIRSDETEGGNVIQLKLALIYNSKNHDNDPTKGIYFETSFTGVPDIIDSKGYNHITFNAVWQHYIPVYKDELIFSYRIVAQNVIVGKIPYYAMINTNILFYKKMTTDAMGGSNSVRGINRNGVIGKGFVWFNAELRWRIFGFRFVNQNWVIGINPFFDAGMVTQRFRFEEQKTAWKEIVNDYGLNNSDKDLIYSNKSEGVHSSAGCGLKIIMNQNFIVSVDTAKALDSRDGDKLKVYVGFNFLF